MFFIFLLRQLQSPYENYFVVYCTLHIVKQIIFTVKVHYFYFLLLGYKFWKTNK